MAARSSNAEFVRVSVADAMGVTAEMSILRPEPDPMRALAKLH
jgi:hypothetical protein